MARHSTSLSISSVIAPDAPLLSPVSLSSDSSAWDLPQPLESFSQYNYYMPPSPPNSVSSSTGSPIPAARALRMHTASDSAPEQEQLCLPTHQVFDFPEANQPAPVSPSVKKECPVIATNVITQPATTKRAASPTLTVTKKPRAVGERISSKDFVPPDVSGLSKREARLVKNRAAAFLSRQRKREEFESMEIRVAELEQENARLLALTQGNKLPEGDLVSEVEQLRAELAAAKERERELSAELAAKSLSSTPPSVKVEASDIASPLIANSRQSLPSLHKSGASLGLMVLLCALPTLLSMPLQSSMPTSFSVPSSVPITTSPFDINSFLPADYDWHRPSSMMDLDSDRGLSTTLSTVPTSGKLEFPDTDPQAATSLGNLDISFDALPSDNGKIRVRIHPSSSASSRSTSPATFRESKSETSISSSSLAMWAGSTSEPSVEGSFSSQLFGSSPSQSYTPSSPVGDPFLGIGSISDYPSSPTIGSLFKSKDDMSSVDHGQSEYNYGSEYSFSDSITGSTRRVRIALKSMPSVGGEGGEWEVQLC